MRVRGIAVVVSTLLVAAQAAAADDVMIEKGKDRVDFKVGKDLVATYHVGPNVAKPYFWPLNAPGNVTVTRAWPMVKGTPGETTDHVHQKSAWFCHGDVIPQDIEYKKHIKGVTGVDFWSEAPGHGKIVCVEVTLESKNPSTLFTRNEWRTTEGMKILDESRTIHLRPVANGYLLILDIDLHASVCSLAFGDTKEGSLGVRVHDQMTEKAKGGIMTNAEGKKGEKEVWGVKSGWCDYSGQITGAEEKPRAVGVAIFDDPKNDPPACWHSRGYGLMAANPFGRKVSGFPGAKDNATVFALDKGKHLKLRYGILMHTGDAEAAKVGDVYKAFSKGKE